MMQMITMKKMKNNYIVYCHALYDGRKYIGITSQKAKNRWRHDGEGYKTTIHFYRAIKKYGWNNFKHIILYTNLTKEEAEQKEIELIDKYNTTDKEYGFNISKGGNSLKGWHQSQETKNRISKTMKGMIANNKGHKQSQETIEKRRLKLLGHKVNIEAMKKLSELKSKKVKCIELNKVFRNIKQASKFINGNKHICDVCKGKRETAGGYHWEYVN